MNMGEWFLLWAVIAVEALVIVLRSWYLAAKKSDWLVRDYREHLKWVRSMRDDDEYRQWKYGWADFAFDFADINPVTNAMERWFSQCGNCGAMLMRTEKTEHCPKCGKEV